MPWPGGLGLGFGRGLTELLGQYAKDRPSYKGSVDFAYIERNLRRELLALGCKDVYLRIGPEPYQATRAVERKGLFGTKWETVTETRTDDNWLVAIYW